MGRSAGTGGCAGVGRVVVLGVARSTGTQPGVPPNGTVNQNVVPSPGADWNLTSSLAKRMVLRDHIEWAATSGLLGAFRDLLEELPEQAWHHMGQ